MTTPDTKEGEAILDEESKSSATISTSETESDFSDDQGESADVWKELPPQREFFATPYDPPVKTLVQEISDKELHVRPTFQRHAVWDQARQSKFVESILLNIPIPTLFFAEDDDKSKVVVDGQQRLLALKAYCENQFALKGLEVLAPLNGKRFDELTDRQQKEIRNRTLRCLIISARSDSEIRFQVFERLNQGGVPLNAQEVRHCVYRGKLNDLLHDVVKNPQWMKLLRLSEEHQRMVDCELALRFFAIKDSIPDYSPPLKGLLNAFMRDHRNPSDKELAELRNTFERAVGNVWTCFGAAGFRRLFKDPKSGKVRIDAGVNRAVFDVQMIVMSDISKDWLEANKEVVLKKFVGLCLTDDEFADAVSRATADKRRLNARLQKWTDALVSLGAELTPIPKIAGT